MQKRKIILLLGVYISTMAIVILSIYAFFFEKDATISSLGVGLSAIMAYLIFKFTLNSSKEAKKIEKIIIIPISIIAILIITSLFIILKKDNIDEKFKLIFEADILSSFTSIEENKEALEKYKQALFFDSTDTSVKNKIYQIESKIKKNEDIFIELKTVIIPQLYLAGQKKNDIFCYEQALKYCDDALTIRKDEDIEKIRNEIKTILMK